MSRYRNVVCPWQTAREVHAQEKFLGRLEKDLHARGWTPEQIDALLNLDKPDRGWRARGATLNP